MSLPVDQVTPGLEFGPSGECDEHGPFLYYCEGCMQAWRKANPERAAYIETLARRCSGLPRKRS